MLKLKPVYENLKAKSCCNDFLYSSRPKFIFGRSIWSESIAKCIDIDGFIDDFTTESIYLNKPIMSINDIPNNAIVISTIIGKPLIAEKRLKSFAFDSLDYFSFYKYAGLPIEPPMFWKGMKEDIEKHWHHYQWVYGLLADKTSKNQFFNIVNFRYSHDLDFMRGFTNQEDRQYFEPFLNLHDAEIFVDVGGFDGYTSKYFTEQVQSYKKIYFFEPEEHNMKKAKKYLSEYQNIDYFQVGLSNKKGKVSFNPDQSASKITTEGSVTIFTDTMDALITDEVTFIKMDIEGAEPLALEGAANLIKKYHPKLAISVYHGKDHFWSIPRQIFAIRDDYDIYLRHYTEGVSETIMYFIPQKRKSS